MWMLGTLVYELMRGEPYWHESMADQQILRVLRDPTRKLPHQERPVVPMVQKLLVRLLERDPEARLTARDCELELTQNATVMAGGNATINAGADIVDAGEVVLE
jgi:serine/threonine protein kinase